MTKRSLARVAAAAVALLALVSCENSLLSNIEADVLRAVTPLVPGVDIRYNGASVSAESLLEVQNGARNETRTHSFSIVNTGDGDLQLSGSPKVDVIDGGSGFFSLSSIQPPSPVEPGGSVDFTVDFTSDTVGSDFTAQVVVATNVEGLETYSFTISSDSYESDSTAPTGAISIASDAVYSTSRSATVSLAASDTGGSGLYQMQVSNTSLFTGAAWEAYSTSKSWTLSDVQGTTTVYARFRDSAGNVSSTASDTIVLDTVNPVGAVIIDSNDRSTDSTSVSLSMTGTDATSGIDDIRLALTQAGLGSASWEAFTSTKAFNLPSGDGTKTVWLQLRDEAGNLSPAYSDSIILDTTAPSVPTIQIFGARSHIYPSLASGANIYVSSSDAGTGQLQFLFGNDLSFSGSVWQSVDIYGSSYIQSDYGIERIYDHDIPSSFGEKTVYVKVRDELGNESTYVSDTIIVDDAYEGAGQNGNNTFNDARNIAPQGWDQQSPTDFSFFQQGMPGYAVQNDSDHYKFTVSSNNPAYRVDITVTEKSGYSDGSLSVWLYRPNGSGGYSSVDSSSVTAGGSGTASYSPSSGYLDGGTWYFRVIGGNNGTEYDVLIDFESDGM